MERVRRRRIKHDRNVAPGLTEAGEQTFWIATGRKMNETVAEARGYIATLPSLLSETTDEVLRFVVPSSAALSAVQEAISVCQECRPTPLRLAGAPPCR
jgi:hypothetical protein